MKSNNRSLEPAPAQQLAVIPTQTEIAKQGLDLNGVKALMAERVVWLCEARWRRFLGKDASIQRYFVFV
jgi:hypothetical protein